MFNSLFYLHLCRTYTLLLCTCYLCSLATGCKDHINVNATNQKTTTVSPTFNFDNSKTYNNTIIINQRQVIPPNAPTGVISFPNTSVPSIDFQKNLALKFLDATKFELRQNDILTHNGTWQQVKVISDGRDALRFEMNGEVLILFLIVTSNNPSTIVLSGTDSTNTPFDLTLIQR